MLTVRRHQEPQADQSRTVRFEGHEFGSAVSFFMVDYEPGQGTGLHLHPYPETWVVRKGEAEFTVGDEKIRAFTGDVVVGPANVPHRFENVGSDRLEVIGIHPSETILQEAA